MDNTSMTRGASFSYAFRRSVPVMLGYLFLGFAFGIVLQRSGYGPFWALLSSVTVFAGSAQFVMADLLRTGAGLLTVFVTILLVNSRHIFYGLTFIEKFRGLKARPYLIFALSDETYSLLCSMPEMDTDSTNRTMFFIALLDQLYWIVGSFIGGIFGEALPVNLSGIDFSMTALFVVILVDQLRDMKNRLPALIGCISAVSFLLLLGSKVFLLPSLLFTVTALFIFRKNVTRFFPLEGKEEKNS